MKCTFPNEPDRPAPLACWKQRICHWLSTQQRLCSQPWGQPGSLQYPAACNFPKAILRPPNRDQKFRRGLYWWRSEPKGDFSRFLLRLLGRNGLTSTLLMADPSIHLWGPSSHISFSSESFLIVSCLLERYFFVLCECRWLQYVKCSKFHSNNKHKLGPTLCQVSC